MELRMEFAMSGMPSLISRILPKSRTCRIRESLIDRICKKSFLNVLGEDVVQNGDGVADYKINKNGSVSVEMESGKVVEGDVLIGADGIWSAIRATMRNEPDKGDGSGVTYSGYTVFAGELKYDSFDNGQVGYKVYIGPGQYFVVTDIGNGNYQWYAFLAREPGSAEKEEKPEGTSACTCKTSLRDGVRIFITFSRRHKNTRLNNVTCTIDLLRCESRGRMDLWHCLGDSVHAMVCSMY